MIKITGMGDQSMDITLDMADASIEQQALTIIRTARLLLNAGSGIALFQIGDEEFEMWINGLNASMVLHLNDEGKLDKASCQTQKMVSFSMDDYEPEFVAVIKSRLEKRNMLQDWLDRTGEAIATLQRFRYFLEDWESNDCRVRTPKECENIIMEMDLTHGLDWSDQDDVDELIGLVER